MNANQINVNYAIKCEESSLQAEISVVLSMVTKNKINCHDHCNLNHDGVVCSNRIMLTMLLHFTLTVFCGKQLGCRRQHVPV